MRIQPEFSNSAKPSASAPAAAPDSMPSAAALAAFGAPPATPTVPSASKDWSPGKTLIVNEGMPVTDRDTLRLVVQSILRNNRGGEEIESLIRGIAESGQSLNSHDEVGAVLRNIIAAKMKEPAWFERGLEYLIRLFEHELMTTRNRAAFLPATKENPDTVFWPDPTHPKHPKSLFGGKFFARHTKFIDRSVPIGSAGSCFAMRIAEMLQKQRFNYVVTEPNLDKNTNFHQSCARWGVIFNVPSFRQLAERAFGLRKMPRLLWVNEVEGKRVLWDSFREDVVFDKVEDYEIRDDPWHERSLVPAGRECGPGPRPLGHRFVAGGRPRADRGGERQRTAADAGHLARPQPGVEDHRDHVACAVACDVPRVGLPRGGGQLPFQIHLAPGRPGLRRAQRGRILFPRV